MQVQQTQAEMDAASGAIDVAEFGVLQGQLNDARGALVGRDQRVL